MSSSKPDEDLVVVCAVRMVPNHNNLSYPYTFKTNDEVPDILRDLLASVMYILDTNYMFIPSHASAEDDEDYRDV